MLEEKIVINIKQSKGVKTGEIPTTGTISAEDAAMFLQKAILEIGIRRFSALSEFSIHFKAEDGKITIALHC